MNLETNSENLHVFNRIYLKRLRAIVTLLESLDQQETLAKMSAVTAVEKTFLSTIQNVVSYYWFCQHQINWRLQVPIIAKWLPVEKCHYCGNIWFLGIMLSHPSSTWTWKGTKYWVSASYDCISVFIKSGLGNCVRNVSTMFRLSRIPENIHKMHTMYICISKCYLEYTDQNAIP